MNDLPPGLQLRRAIVSEANDVAGVWLRSRHASVPAIPAPVHTDDEVRWWFVETVLPTKEVWVAVDDHRIVALMVLEGSWLDQLFVDPSSYGCGIGSLLIDRAKHEQPDGLDLWVFASNSGARRFYDRHGFVVVDATAGDNEEGQPDVRYRWSPTT